MNYNQSHQLHRYCDVSDRETPRSKTQHGELNSETFHASPQYSNTGLLGVDDLKTLWNPFNEEEPQELNLSRNNLKSNNQKPNSILLDDAAANRIPQTDINTNWPFGKSASSSSSNKKVKKSKSRENQMRGSDEGDMEFTENDSDNQKIFYKRMNDVMHQILEELRRGKTIPTTNFRYDKCQRVLVGAMFQHLSDIDTVEEHFCAELVIQARWEECQFAGMSEMDLCKIEFKHCWNPEFKLLNLAGGFLECEKGSMLIRYEADCAYPVVTYLWHVRGLFSERMELEHFPLDVQELSVVLSTDRPVEEVDLVPDYCARSNMSQRANNNLEWVPYKHVTFKQDISTSESLGTVIHPVLVMSVHVKRNIGFYMWNIVFILFLIIMISFCTLALPVTSPTRITVMVTLFLTTVAFKLVIKNSIPRVAYLTYLDLYVVFILLYLTTQVVVNSFLIHLSKYRSDEQLFQYEEILQSFIICLVILFHLIFFIYVMFTAMKRRRDMGAKTGVEHKANVTQVSADGKPANQRKAPF